MYYDDIIIKQTRTLSRAVLKLLFDIKVERPLKKVIDDDNTDILKRLLALADNWEINQAENALFEICEQGNIADFKTALIFYAYINEKSDAFLKDCGFAREEIGRGIMDAAELFGVEGLVSAVI